jgi:hypothetical protein
MLSLEPQILVVEAEEVEMPIPVEPVVLES